MACNCVDEMNAKLAEHNTRLCLRFGFPRDGSPSYTLPALSAEKINTRNRKSVLPIPSYCPFCGQRYEQPKAEAA